MPTCKNVEFTKVFNCHHLDANLLTGKNRLERGRKYLTPTPRWCKTKGMEIRNTKTSTPAAAPKRSSNSKKSGSKPGFSSHIGEGQNKPQEPEQLNANAGVAQTSSVEAVDALLALQEAQTATQGRSKGLKRAELALMGLEDIHRGLLLGKIPVSSLEKLEKVATAKRDPSLDPRLNTLLDDIELRVKVELAKLGQSVKLNP